MSLRRLLALFLILAAPALARADDVRVIGDSIGEGLHLVTGIPSPANRFNVAIYTRKALDQMREAPKGAVVIMSLGTNDAVGGLDDQKDKVAEIVATAEKLGVKLYWVGPPCVLTKWENHAKALDANLAKQLEGTSVTYVSAQDPEFCASSVHAGDGVHFTMAGYGRLWQKAATVAGVPVVVASSATPRAGSSQRHTPGRHRHHHHATQPYQANKP